MKKTWFYIGILGDLVVRVGTFTVIAVGAWTLVTQRFGIEWTPGRILLSAILAAVYSAYLWAAMNAENTLTALERNIGLRARLRAYRYLQIGLDPKLFPAWAKSVAADLIARREVERKLEEIQRGDQEAA